VAKRISSAGSAAATALKAYLKSVILRRKAAKKRMKLKAARREKWRSGNNENISAAAARSVAAS